MVSGGSGVGIVDPDIISESDGELLVSRPLSPPLIWTLAMITSTKGATSSIAQSFIDWMGRQTQ
jgi:DNA-binding transcriptional LysR family regulator